MSESESGKSRIALFVEASESTDVPTIESTYYAAKSELEYLMPCRLDSAQVLFALVAQLVWNTQALSSVHKIVDRWKALPPETLSRAHLPVFALACGITNFFSSSPIDALRQLERARFLADRCFDDGCAGTARVFLARCDFIAGRLDPALAYARYAKLLLRNCGFRLASDAAEKLEGEILDAQQQSLATTAPPPEGRAQQQGSNVRNKFRSRPQRYGHTTSFRYGNRARRNRRETEDIND